MSTTRPASQIDPATRILRIVLAASLVLAVACSGPANELPSSDVEPATAEADVGVGSSGEAVASDEPSGAALESAAETAVETGAAETSGSTQSDADDETSEVRRRAELERREAEARAREAELARREEIARRERELQERERELAERERRLAAEQAEARETEETESQEPAVATDERAEERAVVAEESPGVASESEQAVLVERDPWSKDETAADREEPWNESWRMRGRADDDREAREASEPRLALDQLGAGTQLDLVVEEGLSSGTSSIGDVFRSRVSQDVVGDRGELIVPAGATVWGRVVDARPLRRVGGRATLQIEFDRLELETGEIVDVRATLLEQGRNKKKDKAKIIGGAIAGAILGRILGDGETAAAGAAVGAAAGTAAAMSAEGHEVEIPAGTELSLVLEEVVTVTTRYGDPVPN